MRHCFLLWIVSTVLWGEVVGQELYPQNYFRSPMDIPIYLSGNFGELRTNHYHSGIDIKTQQVIGKNIYAIAEGYVSRIKISPYGYGKALYIDHPNGFTSVYAHLSAFSPEIEAFVKKIQYEKESFAIDTTVLPFELEVMKGEVIAKSGNSGSSLGPHLHFEIRETYTEKPLNPLLFGFDVKDETSPKIRGVYVYPIGESSLVNGKNRRVKLPVKVAGNSYVIDPKDYPTVEGEIGFAIDAKDYIASTPNNHYGIYHMKLKVADRILYEMKFDSFSFDETRYINSHIDYELKVAERRQIHKAFLAPNQHESFSTSQYGGTQLFYGEGTHPVEFRVADIEGNSTTLRFQVKATTSTASGLGASSLPVLSYNQDNTYESDSLYYHIPALSFYQDTPFETKQKKRPQQAISPCFAVGTKYIPVHQSIEIGIKPSLKLDSLQAQKALLVRVDNEAYQACGGTLVDGRIQASVRYLGDYAVAIDTIPPSITKRNTKTQGQLDFTIKDDLSGIKHYRGTIDGRWVVFEYDAKRNHLYHILSSERIGTGKQHQLKLVVTDERGNSTTYEESFFW